MRSLARSELDTSIRNLRHAGSSIEAIARSLGCGATTVWKRIDEMREAGIDIAQKTASEAEPAEAPPLTPAQQAQLPAWRTCLGGCGKIFESSSARNRICPRCQSRRDNVHPFTPDTL